MKNTEYIIAVTMFSMLLIAFEIIVMMNIGGQQMTTGQISMLHNLCVQINLLAAKRDDAPVVIYTMVGDNKFAPVICISVYEGKPFKEIMSLCIPTDKTVDKKYRLQLKMLKDIKKKLEVKENE